MNCGRASPALRKIPPRPTARRFALLCQPANPIVGRSIGVRLASRTVACDLCVAVHPKEERIASHAHYIPVAAPHAGLARGDIRLSSPSLLLRRLHGPLLLPLWQQLLLHTADGWPNPADGCPAGADRGSHGWFALERSNDGYDWYCKERPWWEHGCGR